MTDVQAGYNYAMGDLFLVLTELMTQENMKLLMEIHDRMVHMEEIREATAFAPPQ